MPRIPPLPEGDWDDDLRPILEAAPRRLEGGRLGDNNIFSSLARHKDLFRAWLPFGGWLLARGVLPARDRELLILRTAWNCQADYEWGHHVELAEAAGVTEDEIDRVTKGPDASDWDPFEATLLRAADELHERSKISDQTWAALAETYDERGLIEIPMLVGHYHLVAYALNSLEVELDEGLEPLP